jgi:hypothetical protein
LKKSVSCDDHDRRGRLGNYTSEKKGAQTAARRRPSSSSAKLKKRESRYFLSERPATEMDSDKFVGTEKDHFLCSICLCVVQDPVEHTDCENVFCGECLTSLPRDECPTCRQSLRNKIKPMNRMVRIFYESLQRHCDDPRCDAIYAWPKQGEHELTCVYLTVRCTYCLAQVQSCALQTHHDTVCAMYPMPCPVPGCTHTDLLRDQLPKHKQDCWELHANLYEARIKALEEEVQQLKGTTNGVTVNTSIGIESVDDMDGGAGELFGDGGY